jgi:predicted ATPase
LRFERFRIRNFKGIEDAKIDLVPAGANVFTLIGLNESGKTTILEALSTFSVVQEETGALYGASTARPQPTSFVPKTLKSNFSGSITITAGVAFDPGEREEIVARLHTETGARVAAESIPETLSITRGYRFESSDSKGTIYEMPLKVEGIPKGARKVRELEWDSPEVKLLVSLIIGRVPQIIYFPTFLFQQPDKIYLNPDAEELPVNRLYRQIVQDIASALDNPLDVEKHILDRILAEEKITDKIINLLLLAPDKQQQITATLNEISAHVTETVFESWSRIFGGDFSDREIVIRPGLELSGSGSKLVYLQFSIKDGKSNYDITERSLGFRWFFSFLLFTLYRVSREGARPALFLLDEPASNLHARAQMQLLDSFPKIATGSNQVIYSTHSHYLINPEWLDQAFIVANSAIDYESVDEGNKTSRNRATRIEVNRYRQFVGDNPTKTTYFQPVLDKLDIVPSRLDLVRPSVLVEGKGDYLILEYVRRIVLKSKSDVAIVPTRGAAGMDELIGLFLGWGVKFMVCLDADAAGKSACARYRAEWGLPDEQVITLADLDPAVDGHAIERFLEPTDKQVVASHFGVAGNPTKAQVQLFFSEKLAKRELVALSSQCIARVTALESVVERFFEKS